MYKNRLLAFFLTSMFLTYGEGGRRSVGSNIFYSVQDFRADSFVRPSVYETSNSVNT